jgi:hypothetical protein
MINGKNNYIYWILFFAFFFACSNNNYKEICMVEGVNELLPLKICLYQPLKSISKKLDIYYKKEMKKYYTLYQRNNDYYNLYITIKNGVIVKIETNRIGIEGNVNYVENLNKIKELCSIFNDIKGIKGTCIPKPGEYYLSYKNIKYSILFYKTENKNGIFSQYSLIIEPEF